MVETEKALSTKENLEALDETSLRTAKKMGFGDAEIGVWYGVSEDEVRATDNHST